MYLDFYGLNREPFHITPDPEFLYLSPSHKEAFATILYGVEKRKGFIAVTGEVGTGKTTILRAYMEQLGSSSIRPIYVFDPAVSFEELLESMLNELGMRAGKRSEFAKLQWLRWYLIQEFKQDHNIALLIDEAQNMPLDTMERLRILSNVETTKEKLIQIVLVGQPELTEKLKQPNLRQLNERMAVRANIRPLDPDESLQYIQHRLAQAGGNLEVIFTPSAVKRIIKYAGGIPRRLNIACDNAMVAGFGSHRRPIPARLVDEVIADLRGKKYNPLVKKWIPLAAGLTVAAGLGIWGVSLLGEPETPPQGADLRPPIAQTAPPAPVTDQAVPVSGGLNQQAVTPNALAASVPPSAAEAPSSVASTQAGGAVPSTTDAGTSPMPATGISETPETPEIAKPEPPPVAVETAKVPDVAKPEPPPVVTETAKAPDVAKPEPPPAVTETAKAPDVAKPETPPAVTETAKVPDVAKPETPPAVTETAKAPDVAKPEMPSAVTETAKAPDVAKPEMPSPVTESAKATTEVRDETLREATAKKEPTEKVADVEPVNQASARVQESNEQPERTASNEPAAQTKTAAVTPLAHETVAAAPKPAVEPKIEMKPAPKDEVAAPPEAIAAPTIEPDTADAKKAVRVIVKGDSLTKLLQSVYGTTNRKLIDEVIRKNPRIQDPDLIYYGDKIVFPALEPSETSGGDDVKAPSGDPDSQRSKP